MQKDTYASDRAFNATLPEKFKKFLFNQVSLTLAIAGATFWLFTYVNAPINAINIHLSSIDTQLQNIEQAHEAYGKLAAQQDQSIIDLNTKFNTIYIQLQDKNIIK